MDPKVTAIESPVEDMITEDSVDEVTRQQDIIFNATIEENHNLLAFIETSESNTIVIGKFNESIAYIQAIAKNNGNYNHDVDGIITRKNSPTALLLKDGITTTGNDGIDKIIKSTDLKTITVEDA